MDYSVFFSDVKEKQLSIDTPNHIFENEQKKIHFFLASRLNQMSIHQFQDSFEKYKKIKLPFMSELTDFYISDKNEVWLGYSSVEGDLIKDNLKKKEGSVFSNPIVVIDLFNKTRSTFESLRAIGCENILFDSSSFLIDINKINMIFINWATNMIFLDKKKSINSMVVLALVFYRALVEKMAIHEFDVKKTCESLEKKSFINPLPEDTKENQQFNATLLSFLSNKLISSDYSDESIIDEFMSKITFRLSQRTFYPCLPEIYHDIVESTEAYSVNYAEIADLLFRDFSLSVFLFRKANLITEKKDGFLDSLSKGLLYIGFKEIMENLRSFSSINDLDSKDNKQEYIDLWVITSFQSYLGDVLARTYVKPLNIEFIRMICLMKNLGSFALVYTMSDTWKKIQMYAAQYGVSDDIAATKSIPLTCHRLSVELAKKWKMHERILFSLEEPVKANKMDSSLDEDTVYRYIASLSRALAQSIAASFVKNPKEYCYHAINTYSSSLSFTPEEIMSCIHEAVEKFVEDIRYTSLEKSDALKRIHFFKKYEFTRTYQGIVDLGLSHLLSKEEHVSGHDSDEKAQQFITSYQKIAKKNKEQSLTTYLLLVKDFYLFDDVLLLENQQKASVLNVTAHVGNNALVFDRFKIPRLKTKDLFQTANLTGRPISVPAVTDSEISGFVPAWYMTSSAYPPSFIYIPIKKMIVGKPMAAFLLAKFHTHDLHLNHNEIQSIISGCTYLELVTE